MTYNDSWPGGKKTRSTTFDDHGKPSVITATYGFHLLGGNRKPYFSITGNTRPVDMRSRGGERGGCIHDLIAEHLPDLKPLIRWHLFDADGQPMHYIANAVYRMEQALGVSTFQEPGSPYYKDPDGRYKWQRPTDKADTDSSIAEHCFRSHVVWGAMPETDTPEALSAIMGCIKGIDLKPTHYNPSVAEALREDAYAEARARIKAVVTAWAKPRAAGLLTAMRKDMEPFGIDVDAAIAAIRPEPVPAAE